MGRDRSMAMKALLALCFALVVVHNTQGAEVAELASLEDGYVVVPMHAGEVADSNGKIHQAVKPKGKVAAAKPKAAHEAKPKAAKPKAAHKAKPKAVHEAKPKAAHKAKPAHPAHKHEKKPAPAKKAKHEKKAKKHEKKKKRLPVQPKQNPQRAQKEQQKHDQKTWAKDVMKFHEKGHRRSKGKHGSGGHRHRFKARTPWQKAVMHSGHHKHRHHSKRHKLPHHNPVPGPVLKLKPKKVHHPGMKLAAIEKNERKEAVAKLKADDKREEKLEGQIQGVELQNRAHISEHKADVAQKVAAYDRESSVVTKDTHIQHQDESKALDAQMLVGTPGELGESSETDSLPAQVERILYGPN